MRGWCSGIYFYKNMRRRTGKRRKEQHRQWAMNQGWERREQREFIAIPRFCCSVFFLLTQWTCREQAAFFYRSHATSQWSMDAGPLQTYTVEHALCGSAKRGHLGERGRTPPPLPLLPSILSAALLPIIPLLCTYFSTSPFFHLSHSDWKPFKDGGDKGLMTANVYSVLLRPVDVLVSLNILTPTLMIWSFQKHWCLGLLGTA